MDQKSFLRKNQTKGIAYSLEEFAEKHGLGSEMAEDLFYRFGPSSIDLDLLMAAKSKRRRELPFVGDDPRSNSIRSTSAKKSPPASGELAFHSRNPAGKSSNLARSFEIVTVSTIGGDRSNAYGLEISQAQAEHSPKMLSERKLLPP